MKTFIIPFLLLLFCQNIYGQVTWKAGAGPQISNRTAGASDLTYDFILGVNADVRAVIRNEKRLQLEVGLGFNQKGDNYEALFSDLRWPSQHDGNGGFNPDIPFDTSGVYNGLSGFRFTHLNSYIELPIQVDYYFSTGSEGIYVFGAIRPSYSFLHKYKITEILDSGKNGERETTDNQSRPKRFNLLARIGFGYEIKTNGLNYFGETYFERQLLDMVTNPIFSQSIHQYGIGLLLGVKF